MKFLRILPWALIVILCLLLTLTWIDRPRITQSDPQHAPTDNVQQTVGSEEQQSYPQLPDSPVRPDSPGFMDRAMDSVSQAARTVGNTFNSFLGGSEKSSDTNPIQAEEKPSGSAIGKLARKFSDTTRSLSDKLRGVPDEIAPMPDLPDALPPSDNLGIMTANSDSDRDGLSDRIETVLGTDPNKTDTDGNGIPDRQDPSSYESVALEGEHLSPNSDDMIDKWIARAQKIADIVLPFVGKGTERDSGSLPSDLVSNFDSSTPSDLPPNVAGTGVDSTSSGSGIPPTGAGASEGTPTTIPKLNLRMSPELLRTIREGLVKTLAEREQAERDLNEASGEIDAEVFQKLSKQLALINAAIEQWRKNLTPGF